MKVSLVASFYYQISLCESKSHSCPTLASPCTIYSPWNSPGQKTGVGSLSLLQGIFPTLGSNPGLPHCRRILYQLSHQGSPGMLKENRMAFLWSPLGWNESQDADCDFVLYFSPKHCRNIPLSKVCEYFTLWVPWVWACVRWGDRWWHRAHVCILRVCFFFS